MAENETETNVDAGEEEETPRADDNEDSNDVTMDSEDESDSDDEQNENETRRKIEELKRQVNENPYMYDTHVALIRTLKEAGELDELRDARQRMRELFPLSEELWLDWLKDEVPLATEEDQRETLYKLFEDAVKDYLSVPVWLEYVQYAIGGIGLSDGVQKIRDVFERALVACSLHVTKGALVWEAYREFENAILAGLLPQPGVELSKEMEDKFVEQNDRVSLLFKRQLSVPLMDMEETFDEYKEWLQEDPDAHIKQAYKKALARLESIREYEDSLLRAEPPRLEEYLAYLKYEEDQGDPARIQVLYERALQENCLNPKMWLQYTKYLDTSLRVDTVSLAVYERAVRNCPWCVQLWQNYILCLERHGRPYDKVKGVFETALTSGFTQGAEYLLIWTTFLDYLRRRINWKREDKEDLQTFRLTIEKALEQIDGFGVEGDPNCTLRQYWANIEARHCNNLEKARDLWGEIMTIGRANEAVLWMEYYRFERANGDNKHCRRVLQRALNSVTDWPESVVDAYINFEREEGTLEQFDQAVTRCDSQMLRINERREKEAEKETALEETKKKARAEKKQQKKGGPPADSGQGFKKPGNRPKFTQSETSKGAVKRKMNDGNSAEADFKVPVNPKSAPPPGFKGEKSAPPPGFKGEKSAPPPGFKGERSAPPPGFKAGSGDSGDEPPTKRAKEDAGSVSVKVDHDSSADFRTVFVSNLAFSVDESQLEEFFKKCGEIEEVRLVKNFQGKSKGFAYVQFKEAFPVATALTYDRTPIENRPMYVSKCEDRQHAPKTDRFKYGTGLEKCKLFIKNLPFTCTEDALRTMFSQHGELRDVRLVTYRNGKPKGLAYVEFVDAESAQKALLKLDGMLVGEHEISVQISNPPPRKTPLTDRDESKFVPSLGGGKKETAAHGNARTQVMLMPRSVKSHPPKKGTPSSTPATQTDSASSSSTQSSQDTAPLKSGGMSNSDFRNLLLKK